MQFISNNCAALVTLYLFIMMCISCDGYEDDYVNDARASCYKFQDTYSCLKFRTLRYISTVVGDDSWNLGNETEDGFFNRSIVNLVRMKKYRGIGSTSDAENFFAETRQLNDDTELDKFVKFGKRQIVSFLKSYGLSIGLPDGAVAVPYERFLSDSKELSRSMDSGKEARGKKKKLAILLPLLSLLSLFKVKLLLVPILLTVLFVKKLLVLAALFLPTILSTLKVCKVPQVSGHNQWASADVSAAEYGAYGGGGYGAYGAANGAHSKEWGASRAYGAYKDSYENHQAYKTISDPPPVANLVYANNGAV